MVGSSLFGYSFCTHFSASFAKCEASVCVSDVCAAATVSEPVSAITANAPKKILLFISAREFIRVFRKPGRFSLCSRLLWRRWFQRRRSVWFLWLVFRFVSRKIFLVDIDDLHLGAELAIAPEKNLVCRLLLEKQIGVSEFHRGRRGQQVLLVVDRDAVIIDDFAGSSDGRARIDFSTDIFQSQHAVRLAINRDSS